MFAVGHLALGYITGKISSQMLNLKANVPLLFFFSILPDIDLFIPFLRHRAPTHSIIVMVLVSLPFLAFYRKRVVPYFLAATQHILIGDFLIGNIQLFWPIKQEWIGLEISGSSLINISMEWVFFSLSLLLMLKTKDLYELLKPHQLNLILIVPVTALLFPILPESPMKIPISLIVPHIVYLTILIISILKDFKY